MTLSYAYAAIVLCYCSIHSLNPTSLQRISAGYRKIIEQSAEYYFVAPDGTIWTRQLEAQRDRESIYSYQRRTYTGAPLWHCPSSGLDASSIEEVWKATQVPQTLPTPPLPTPPTSTLRLSDASTAIVFGMEESENDPVVKANRSAAAIITEYDRFKAETRVRLQGLLNNREQVRREAA